MDSRYFRLFYKGLLWLFVAHTSCVAIGLFVLPGSYLPYFGFEDYQGRFFQMQAGVFHLVMGVAYLLAIYHGEREAWFVYFAVLAKSIAFLFLVIYFVLFEQIWMVIFSACADGGMGLLLLLIYRRLKQTA